MKIQQLFSKPTKMPLPTGRTSPAAEPKDRVDLRGGEAEKLSWGKKGKLALEGAVLTADGLAQSAMLGALGFALGACLGPACTSLLGLPSLPVPAALVGGEMALLGAGVLLHKASNNALATANREEQLVTRGVRTSLTIGIATMAGALAAGLPGAAVGAGLAAVYAVTLNGRPSSQ